MCISFQSKKGEDSLYKIFQQSRKIEKIQIDLMKSSISDKPFWAIMWLSGHTGVETMSLCCGDPVKNQVLYSWRFYS